MRQVETYRQKKILVIGMGKSGVSVAKLLAHLGAFVTVNDKSDPVDLQEVADLEALGVKVITGSHPLSLLEEDFVTVVKNPGIPYTNPLVAGFVQKQTPIVTEVEIAGAIFGGELIGVTGSNGKTTTTTMIQEMLNGNRGHIAYKAGNIGISFSDIAQQAQDDETIVAELSSFQLLGAPTLHPHIAVLTNVFSNHLDYHKTREAYVNAKMNIIKNQTESDFFVVNWDNPEWQALGHRGAGKIVPFSRLGLSTDGAYVNDGMIYFRDEKIMPANQINVVGEHNLENALAAVAVAKLENVATSKIVDVLENFGGVRHRMQFVATLEGREIYNDSKATDIEATEMALNGFSKSVILLAGGLDRGYTFEKLESSLKDHVKALIVFGESGSKVAAAGRAAGVTTIVATENAETAVPLAFQYSEPGDVILLSPANASWDQYPSFEVRGDKFIEAVEQYTGKKVE